jgi:signal transduction histidine kinase/CheY-like chemotaxis protein
MTGYSAHEAMEGGLALIIKRDPTGDRKQSSASSGVGLEEIMEKGFYRGAISTARKDARLIQMDLAVTVVRDYRTRAASVVCTARDITDEGELRAELSDARRMDTIATVASGVAHDFNNLLMVISVYAELGLQTLYCDHPLRRNLEEILSAVRRATELSRQVLASGRGRAPGQQAVDLNSLIEDSCRLLRRVVGEDVDLQISLGEDAGRIEADPGQIERVLLNLALNARDAMPSGGILTITTQALGSGGVPNQLDVKHGKYVLMQVTDNGQGIPAERISKIFLPFYTTKSDRKGTGLGLAMVQKILKQSGGAISVESEPDKGTVFRMYFPVSGNEPESSTDKELVECHEVRGSETVLVVEDDESVRECSVEFLSSVGYQVLAAGSGEEAVAVAARHKGKIDLMLADVVMPGVNGAKLALSLTELQPNIKVLFVSGHGGTVARLKGVEADAHFLEKPYPFALLATTVRNMLEPSVKAHAATAGGTR